MRNLSIIFAMLFFGISLSAQEETVSYIMNDGSVKTYNLNDIEDISTQKGQDTYEMKIYLKDSAPVSYFSNQFDSVKYSKDSYNNYAYIVYSGTNQFSYLLANIDSISYNYDIVSENTVKIGNQTWMTKNLDVDRYRNGDPIPQITEPTEWINLKTGAWCYYNNDPAMGAIYGKLYNWYAVNDPRGLAPDGWHVPTNAELTELENCLIASGFNYDGTTTGNKIAIALASASGWNSASNEGVVGNTDYPEKRNATGFSALPGGYRYVYGSYLSIGNHGSWWLASEYVATFAWDWGLFYDYSNIHRGSSRKDNGFSVRCVRD